MTRRGAILLELLLAAAIFAMAGMAVYGAVGRAAQSAAGARERLVAADLAWSAIALIDAGAARPETLVGPLRETSPLWPGPDPGPSVSVNAPSGWEGWEIGIQTEPARFPGLTLVEVTATRRQGDRETAAFTARQLVRLGAEPAGETR